MRKVFESMDFTRVGHYQSILETNGIATLVKNMAASSVMGDVPFTEVYPELWVVNDDDYEKALTILKEHKEVADVEGTDWVCAECSEEVSKEFGECWNCGTDRPEVS